jgi:hypothetical protein
MTLILLVLITLITGTLSAFRYTDRFSQSPAVPSGAALLFAAPHRSALRWTSAAARLASTFVVGAHRSVRVLTHAELSRNPFVSRRHELLAQGVSILECGTAALAVDGCDQVLFPDGSASDQSACLEAIYLDQVSSVLDCVADVPRPSVVIFDAASAMFAVNVALRFGVPAVLVSSQLDSAADASSSHWFVSRLWSHKAIHDQCALLGLNVCWPTDVRTVAHTHNQLVLDWFDGTADIDDGRGVLRVLPLGLDEDGFRYQAALDITDDSDKRTASVLAGGKPFVFVSFGDIVQPTTPFIERVIAQLDIACQSGAACHVLWAAGARRNDIGAVWPTWITPIHTALPHFGVFESKLLRAVVTGGDTDEIGDAIVHNVPLAVVPLRADTHRNAAFVAKHGIGFHVQSLETLGASLAKLVAPASSDVRAAMQRFHDKWRQAQTSKLVQSAIRARVQAASPDPPPPAPIGATHEADEATKRVVQELASWKDARKAQPSNTKASNAVRSEL